VAVLYEIPLILFEDTRNFVVSLRLTMVSYRDVFVNLTILQDEVRSQRERKTCSQHLLLPPFMVL
jgi:hypothetical protein